ncbi:MAG: hypothetical protein RLZZ524_3112 [Pseudomonadota bacterium]
MTLAPSRAVFERDPRTRVTLRLVVPSADGAGGLQAVPVRGPDGLMVAAEISLIAAEAA